MQELPPEALKEVSLYFQALAQPARLQLLNLLRGGDRSVGELAGLCGFTAANVSRHMALLTRQGLVEREGRGTSVYYRIADPAVYALCDVVCDSISRRLERTANGRRAFARARRATGGVAEKI
jgi:DNA-binding transcriptional ArsR family regulator